MSQRFPKKIYPYNLLILAEMKTLCGQPPVLSTESTEAYNTMLLRIIESIWPRDFIERLFCRHIADSTWGCCGTLCGSAGFSSPPFDRNKGQVKSPSTHP
jgi:hypothetical protein